MEGVAEMTVPVNGGFNMDDGGRGGECDGQEGEEDGRLEDRHMVVLGVRGVCERIRCEGSV